MPIETRHRTYFATLRVPDDVKGKLGRSVFRQTLKTDSRSVAERRAAPMVAGWKAEIAKARGEPDADDTDFWTNRTPPDPAAYWTALRGATTDRERATVLDRIADEASDLAMDADPTDPDDPLAMGAAEFHAIATGERVTVTEHLDEYIASIGHLKSKTAGMRRAAVERLGQKFRLVRDVTRPSVRRWVTELSSDLAGPTIQRIITDCRGYWTYLAVIGVVPEDAAPFDKLRLTTKTASWKQFEPAEVVRLHDGAMARGERQLADLIRLAMYTGARREELCALRVENVKADRFDIIAAKTAAGVRTVPIHPELRETMARLVKVSTDGCVLTELEPNRHGVRGDGIGKRFTRLKQALGFDGQHVFHSLRGTVITMLERAGVPESTVQDIVGHERSTLTGSTYSGKSTFEMKSAALARLAYPKA